MYYIIGLQVPLVDHLRPLHTCHKTSGSGIIAHRILKTPVREFLCTGYSKIPLDEFLKIPCAEILVVEFLRISVRSDTPLTLIVNTVPGAPGVQKLHYQSLWGSHARKILYSGVSEDPRAQ